MSAATPALNASAPTVRRLVQINTLSFLAQVVQIGTVPAFLALRLTQTHHSALVVGLIAAAPWMAILLLGHRAPRVLARLGFVRTNGVALALSVVALGGMLLTRSPPLLFGLNLLLGTGLIIRWVACDTWIVAEAPVHLRGRIIGTHETLMGCGIAAGPALLALTGVHGLGPLWACLLLLCLSAIVLSQLSEPAGRPAVPERGGALRALRLMPTALVAGFLAGYVETSSISFLPVFSEHALFALGAAATLGGFGVGGTVLQFPLGTLADRCGYRVAQLLCCSVILAGVLAFPLIGHSPALLLPMLFIWGGAAGGMNTLAVIEAGERMDSAAVSTAMAAIALAYTVGSITGPLFVGFATTHFALLGFLLAIGVATGLFLGACLIAGLTAARARSSAAADRPGALSSPSSLPQPTLSP